MPHTLSLFCDPETGANIPLNFTPAFPQPSQGWFKIAQRPWRGCHGLGWLPASREGVGNAKAKYRGTQDTRGGLGLEEPCQLQDAYPTPSSSEPRAPEQPGRQCLLAWP